MAGSGATPINDLAYKASKWGNEYHELVVHEALGAGSAGPGKSLVLLNDPVPQVQIEHLRCLERAKPGAAAQSGLAPWLVELVEKNPLHWGESTGWALHLRREFPMLHETVARAHRIFPRIDPDARYVAQDHMWIFSSGYRFQFGHCKDPDDWQRYHSSQFTHVGYDELVQFEEEQYQQINTRVRSADPVLMYMLKIRAMSNPVMRREANFTARVSDPQWVRSYFVDPHREGRKILKKKIMRRDGSETYRTRIYLPATLYDNPDPVFVRQYEESLLDKPAHIRAAMLYGDWYVVVGSFFGDAWNPQLHVCRPFRIPEHWPRFRSMDWGFKLPGCVLWWAMDDDGNLFCEHEWTFSGMEAVAVAKSIKQIENDKLRLKWVNGRSPISGPADTQLWEERGDKGKSKAEDMAVLGVPWFHADKKYYVTDAERVLIRLLDHRKGTTTPGLVFFDGCKLCIRTLPAIQTDPTDTSRPLDGGDDHHYDAIRYAVTFASHGKVGIPKRRSAEQLDDEEIKSERKTYNRGRYGYGNSA